MGNTKKSTTNLAQKRSLLRPSGVRLDGAGDFMDEWNQRKQVLKPEDQEVLEDYELKEEVQRMLLATNPQAPKNVVEYKYKVSQFVPLVSQPPTTILYHLESCTILKESAEAQAQIAAGDYIGEEGEGQKKKEKKHSIDDEEDEDATTTKREPVEEETAPEEEEAIEEPPEEDEGQEDEEGEDENEEDEEGGVMEIEVVPEEEEGEGRILPKRKKKLPNAFNFCENAALTYNNPCRDMSTQTVPLPQGVCSGLISTYMIFDHYAEDYEKQQKEKEKETKKPLFLGKKEAVVDKKKAEAAIIAALQMKTYEAAKTLDRMICQNLYDDISQDYRYYEDPSDEFRNLEGTLLPLWKFSYEPMKKSTVTDIQWNTRYYDMFAVTFGSFDHTKQPVGGCLCLFTLKNPSYPEYIRHTLSSALSVSIHPNLAHLIAVGFYNGNLAVYNSTTTNALPQYESNPLIAKHNAPISQVKWGRDMQDGELNMFSISTDGFVFNWIVVQAELSCTSIIRLTLPIESVAGPDGAVTKINASGATICFHPTDPRIYLAGTEEGKIYECNVQYNYKYLFTYEAHTLAVRKVSYNRFYTDIFLSCSADWTVKIWETQRSAPLFAFDLGTCVGDCQWAPYSSTVFAAVTTDGKCHVFDINVNKYKSICTQNVTSRKNKNKLHRLRFNYNMPIIIVGDERGTITTLKLSPNLRMKPKPPKKKEAVSEPRQLEIIKLEKILSFAKEPVILEPPPDIESIKLDR